jgi:hypothetical protein
MNTTITNIINDCGNQVHFSRKLLENYWWTLDSNVKFMMNTLSEQIYKQFVKSIEDIDIPEDMNLLVEFLSQANVSNIPMLVKAIETDLTILEGYFGQINASNSTLPDYLVQTTVDQVSLIEIIDKLDLKFMIILVQSLCEKCAGINC